MSDASVRLENLAGAFAVTAGRAIERAVGDATGLGPTEAAALVAIGGFAHGGRQDALAAALDLSQPGTARAVERLATRELLARRRGERDGRETRLELTAAGRRALSAVLTAREHVLVEALAPLGAAERRRLEATLERVLAGMTADRVAARRICRLCDGEACGHPAHCPVTQAADAA